ncbi:MAG: DUF4336 domain-containing protein, partial [Moorea sp. SIO2B7]|nr:DUF4336 domain-containing protein [Moorena sp. SIO2B7]
VKYIILPTASGLEHKVFVGPFARRFPQAQVFVAPHQWSFPLNLPLSWLGFPGGRTQILPENSADAPFAAEFDYAQLGPINLGLGTFEEIAFFHKHSRTLLVTDSVVSISKEPPAIAQLDPYPLLFHAKDNVFEQVEDNEANRRKGWQRISLFAFYFQPNALEIPDWGEVFRDALKAPERSKKVYFGLFPFRWRLDWQKSFEALRGDGRLFVAPILQTLILNRAPQETINWANKVASWNFEQIISCHFDAPISAKPYQFRQAFAFLENLSGNQNQPLPQEDFELLRNMNKQLNRLGITPPAKQ